MYFKQDCNGQVFIVFARGINISDRELGDNYNCVKWQLHNWKRISILSQLQFHQHRSLTIDGMRSRTMRMEARRGERMELGEVKGERSERSIFCWCSHMLLAECPFRRHLLTANRKSITTIVKCAYLIMMLTCSYWPPITTERERENRRGERHRDQTRDRLADIK